MQGDEPSAAARVSDSPALRGVEQERSSGARGSSRNWPAWFCIVTWLGWSAALALLLLQWRMATLHPAFVPFVAAIGMALVALVALLVAVGRDLARERDDRNPVAWALIGIVPALLFAALLGRAGWQWSRREVPHGVSGQIVMYTAGTMMEAQAQHLFPRQLASERLVMYYTDLASPEEDLATMDRHVARLEDVLDRPLVDKIHWVRGSLLGQGACSFLGLALGSSKSPAGPTDRGEYLDRHELAHAVLTQCREPSADPPMVLHEGWAESQSNEREMVLVALDTRSRQPQLRVADLFSPSWYHRDSGPVYQYGGAFVDFLVRRHGVARFVAIYNRCRPESYESDFRAIYGQSLGELEAAFWQDIAPQEGVK